ncbi:MAG: 4Fe-4S binding protein [Firmicutes bacterium]|nr:4Fe-4S binding protein [Bacillota bacterium]
MLDLEKIALLVASRMGPLLADHRRCTRIRSPLSKCSLCQELCPVQALSFHQGEGISFADSCLECGLCAAVCPTGALKIQEPTEMNLLQKIEALGENGAAVALGCRRNRELDQGVLTVPCLGSLSREFLLLLDGLPFPVYLIHNEETCSGCPVTKGGELCRERLKELRSFQEGLGLASFSIKNVGQVPGKVFSRKRAASGLGRRAFFRSLWGGARKVPLMALESFLNGETEKEKGITELPGLKADRLAFLQRALLPVHSPAPIPFLAQPFLRQACHFCRACVVLCPVGALKCEVDGDHYRLLLHQNLCTGCGLCAQVCYHESLELAPAAVAHVKREEPLVLAQGEKKSCSICGQEMIISGPAEECFLCRKKALLDAN